MFAIISTLVTRTDTLLDRHQLHKRVLTLKRGIIPVFSLALGPGTWTCLGSMDVGAKSAVTDDR